MKRKLWLLGLILILAAITILPFEVFADTNGTTSVTGQVESATISITAPSPVNLGLFKVGDLTGSSQTPGTVTVTAGTKPYPFAYSVLAVDANEGAGKGFMMNGTTPLSTTNKLQISPDSTTYYPADTGFSYTGSAANGNPINLPFFAKQTISGTEIDGNYSITIKFSASLP